MVEKECPPELLENLAALEHDRWSGWIKHQFKNGRFDNDGTTWTMPQWAVARWMKLSVTPYEELDEETKESDRVEVRKTWSVVAKALESDEKRRALVEDFLKRVRDLQKGIGNATDVMNGIRKIDRFDALTATQDKE